MASSHRITLPASETTEFRSPARPRPAARRPMSSHRLMAHESELCPSSVTPRCSGPLRSRSALHNQPLAPWERAAILDRAAALLRERQEEFAQIIAREAAKPLKTARVEADRAAGTFTFAAVEARKLAGEVIPIAAAPGGDTKVAYTMRVPIGSSARSARSTFPSTSSLTSSRRPSLPGVPSS